MYREVYREGVQGGGTQVRFSLGEKAEKKAPLASPFSTLLRKLRKVSLFLGSRTRNVRFRRKVRKVS